MTEYFYGKTIRLSNTFTDETGTAYDPDTVSLVIYDAEETVQTTVTYAAEDIQRTATGVYHYDYTIPAAATSQGYWLGTWTVVIGTQTDISEEQFYARPSTEKLYVSVAEVKAAIMTTGVTMSDDTIRNAIRGCMDEVDTITGRVFTSGHEVTEWFDTDQANPNVGVTMLFLTYMPVQSITTLKEYNTSNVLAVTHASGAYWCSDVGVLELARTTFTHQRHRVECVYVYGYDEIPGSIRKLTSVIAQIEVLRNYMVDQDSKVTSFSVDGVSSVTLGEVYQTARLAIDMLERKKKTLVAEIGNLRNDCIPV